MEEGGPCPLKGNLGQLVLLNGGAFNFNGRRRSLSPKGELRSISNINRRSFFNGVLYLMINGS
jgi:hypothetical protein